MATLYLRGKMWYSRVMIQGKDVRMPLSKNKRQAILELARILDGSKRAGASGGRMGWTEFVRVYLEGYCHVHKAYATYKTERWALDMVTRHCAPQRLADVTPARLLALVPILRAKKGRGKSAPLSPWTVNRLTGALKSTMRWAERQTPPLIGKQDWSIIHDLPHARGRTVVHDRTPLRAFRNSLDGCWLVLFWLCARAGLRRAEAYHLQVRDLDFDHDALAVVPKGSWVPKSAKSRYVPLLPDLRAFLGNLASRRGALGTWRPDSWVFASDDGTRPTLGSTTKVMADKFREAKMEGAPIHSLRHDFVSYMVDAGFNLREVGEMVGHSQQSMTAAYSHLVPSSVRDKLAKARPL